MTDVTVGVPTARLQVETIDPSIPLTPESLYQLQYAELQQVRKHSDEVREMAYIATTISLGLLKLLADLGYASEQNEVTIPLGVHKFMKNASIEQTFNEQGDIVVRLIERQLG